MQLIVYRSFIIKSQLLLDKSQRAFHNLEYHCAQYDDDADALRGVQFIKCESTNGSRHKNDVEPLADCLELIFLLVSSCVVSAFYSFF